MRAELEPKMERTEMRMIKWMCTDKKPRCRGNCGCDEKMQTEVTWTCGNKGQW